MREIKPIKIAILSCNHGHAKGYYKLRYDPFYELVACSIEPGYRPYCGIDQLEGIPCYDSDEELYENHPELEAVVIASANRKHMEQVREAVKRGLHIYSMKVPTYDLDEYREMIELTESKGIVYQVELEMRHHTEVYRVKELIDSGAIGEVLSINMLNYSHNPGWWRPWQVSPEESYGRRVKLSPDSKLYRGGALADHPHVFDIARLLTGSTFDTVYAEAAPNFRDFEVDRVKELIDSGAIGEVLSINMLNYSHNPGWWRPWQVSPEESYGRRVKLSPDSKLYRGGALADHPHVFDIARLLTGSTFDTVYAEAAPNFRDFEVEDLIRVMGRMKNGVLFSLDPSYANNENRVTRQSSWEKYPRCVEVTMNVVGTKGTIIADLYGRAFSSQRDEGGYYLSSGPGTVGLWNRRMQEFYECVRYGMKVPVGLREHYESIATMVAAYESVSTGEVIKMDFEEPVKLESTF